MVRYKDNIHFCSLTNILAWISHLTNAVPNCKEIPMMHVSLLSVEHDVPWTFITPYEMPHPPSSNQSRSSSKEPPVFIDVSASTWAMYPTASHPLSSPTLNICNDLTYIPDPTERHPPPGPPSPPLLPISSTALIHTSSSPSSPPSTLHLHLLYTLKTPSSSLSIPDIDTHRDITMNYHELSVVSSLRWHLGASGREGLPFHLAAVEVMREALDTGEAGFE
jgi:mediator of RNA polymerase II transcription subunit 13